MLKLLHAAPGSVSAYARCMTMPRRVVPGMTVMITRRTLRRTHLLRPDPEINNLYLYCLAVLAPRFDIRVHAAVLMSTHEHLIVTDVRGQLPRFIRELHRLFALGIKILRKWEGAVWDHEKTSIVELRTPAAIIEKIAYVIANPVAAGLVRRAHDWPGVTVRPGDLGRHCSTSTRPEFYFDPANPLWPSNATLELAMPELDMLDDDVRYAVAAELEHLERAARESVRARGLKCLDAKRVARLSPYKRAKSIESLRDRNPTFAVGRGQREAFVQAVAMVRDFRRAYRLALERWRCALRDTVFPHGTWLMGALHQAVIAPL
jgi:REP element-mobilizing transposase RayT